MADETPAIIPSERAPASRLDRTLREKLILVAMAGGAMMAIAGGAAAGADVTRGFGPGVLVASLGSLLAFGAMALSYGIPSLERMRTARAYSRHAQLQQWTRLKAVGMTFSVLTGLGVFILATAMMTRIAPNGFEASFALVARLTLLLNGVLAVGLAASHFLSLHPALERPRAEGMAQMGFYLAGTASAGLAVLAAAMAFVPLDIAGFVKLRPIDPPFFLLASTTFGAVALFVSRSIPTLHVLFGDERTYYTGDNYFSRTKSVVMPALMALTMLLLVVLVLMLLGAGLAGLAGDIPQNHFLLGLLGFVAVALLFTGTMALRLAKSEDQVKLYRQGRSLEQRQSLIILGASGAVASVCALLAGLLYFRVSVLGIPQTRWIDFLCFTLLALCGPYGFWMNRKNKRMRSLEARFPDFLRDLAASRKAGLTLTAAVQNAARGEYGALTPEIRTMADQLSWDVPFEEALAGFGKRVRTPLVE
ncbi:MAG TPA: type II secretion system F family protein, partial [Candidatus Thermoplasmatota archaeon]|nr:type II secretion system F family protein [Candidatus Thermoplasmatota archaeon]